MVPLVTHMRATTSTRFSLPGKKIDWMRLNPLVSVSVVEREREPAREWKSVIVDGRYEELPDRIGHKAERAPAKNHQFHRAGAELAQRGLRWTSAQSGQ